MSNREPTSAVIKFICDNCGHLNEVEGSYNPHMFTLRFRYAECRNCGQPRTRPPVGPGYFKCIGCRIVYKRYKHWRPTKGRCPTCNMRLYRKRTEGKRL